MRSSPGAAYDKCGILIYTASTGAQGTLGGLVGVAARFANILQAAVRRLEICSNDPICAIMSPTSAVAIGRRMAPRVMVAC